MRVGLSGQHFSKRSFIDSKQFLRGQIRSKQRFGHLGGEGGERRVRGHWRGGREGMGMVECEIESEVGGKM